MRKILDTPFLTPTPPGVTPPVATLNHRCFNKNIDHAYQTEKTMAHLHIPSVCGLHGF